MVNVDELSKELKQQLDPQKEIRLEDIHNQLTEMLDIMNQMNKRDRRRSIGGWFHTFLSLVPVLFLVGSVLYFFWFGDSLLDMITQKAADAVKTSATTNSQAIIDSVNPDDLINSFRDYFPEE